MCYFLRAAPRSCGGLLRACNASVGGAKQKNVIITFLNMFYLCVNSWAPLREALMGY